MQDQRYQLRMQRVAFGMPAPQGWTIERIVNLMVGTVVLITLTLGREHSSRWRLLDAMVGRGPARVLHRLGFPTDSERARGCGIRLWPARGEPR
jgi:hypothetical protein